MYGFYSHFAIIPTSSSAGKFFKLAQRHRWWDIVFFFESVFGLLLLLIVLTK